MHPHLGEALLTRFTLIYPQNGYLVWGVKQPHAGVFGVRAGRRISRWALAAATVMLSAGTVLANPLPAEADPISSPASVTLTPGRRMIKVEWTAPVNPASPVATYTATASTGESCTVSSPALTCTIT